MYAWIIVLGLIVLGIFLYLGRNGSKMGKRETPLEILNRRFANGEITKEEFEEQKRIINS
tara:strand:- start:173 stop:352 length:180 start_codon:yes stop_codon:yes gene_type:complete